MTKLSCLVITVTAVACARRPPIAAPMPYYECTDTAVVPHGDHLEVRDRNSALANIAPVLAVFQRRDDDGDHFTSRTLGETFATEYVVPGDPREDLTVHIVDLANARQVFVRRDVCMARGGYSDAFSRYVKGETFEDIARDLSLGDRDSVRYLVYRAMLSVQRRYYRDR